MNDSCLAEAVDRAEGSLNLFLTNRDGFKCCLDFEVGQQLGLLEIHLQH